MVEGAEITRRDAARGTLAGLFAASVAMTAGCRRASVRAGRASIEGGFVDEGIGAGHRLRDGGWSIGGAIRERRCRVLVVGGGVAGLAAAWRLARAGVEEVVVTELAPAIGGTSRAGEMALTGGGSLRCPFGAHYLPLPRAEQRALAAFLRDAGIAGDGVDDSGRLRVLDRDLVRDPAERVAGLGGYFEEGLWLEAGACAADHAAIARFEQEVSELIDVDAKGRRLFDLPVERSSRSLRDLDRISAADWAAERGFDGKRMRWYLEYATRDDFGATLEDTSAWALLHYFAARGDLATKESAPYLTWPEGNARLVAHLAGLSGASVETGTVALRVEPRDESGATVDAASVSGEQTRWTADAVILATPQFVTKRLLTEDPARDARSVFRYAPWVVANLHLRERPVNRGFPWAWDSVLHGSTSLGYVDASHQLDRAESAETVWSWYMPITDSDEHAARRQLLGSSWGTWRDAILGDLRKAHPDIDDVVTRIDVWRWGHGMVKPTPGTMFGGARGRAMESIGAVHFAHSDLSGMALFEEAHWQGTRAAEEVLSRFGLESESLL